MGNALQVPTAREPLSLRDAGGNQLPTRSWYLFWQGVADRVGAALGLAPSGIAVGASPFSYTAPNAGTVLVRGGTVTVLELGRGGVFVNIGVVAGPVPVSAADVVRVTHAGAPTMTYVQR